MNETFATLAYSSVIAVVGAIICRRLGWGMAIPLIVLGAIFGAMPFGPDSIPEPEVILVFVLAPLVFGEALGSSFLDLRRVSRPVVLLAVVLVLASTAVVGWAAAAVVAMPVAMAVALGAILAPTDAVALSSVAKSARMPRRLVSILEGEALVNDGTGLTMLSVAITAMAAGSITLIEVGEVFIRSVAGGVAIGLIAGWIITWAMRKDLDTVAVNGLVLVAPFALYMAAEEIEGSGILAVVVAGLMIAHSVNSTVDHSGRLQSVIVWKHITFALQAMAFFLIGLEFPEVMGRLDTGHLRAVLILVPVVLVAMILTRFVFVFLMGWVGGRRSHAHRATTQAPTDQYEVPLWKRTVILGWAAARGPVSGLAAFSIPLILASGEDTPYRDVVIAVTFCIVVITLLLSLTLAPIVKMLRIPSDDDSALMRHVHEQLVLAATVRLDELEAQAAAEGRPLSEATKTQLRLELARNASRHGVDFESEVAVSLDDSKMAVHVTEELLAAQQRELLRLRSDESLPESVVRPLLRSMDARMQGLRALD